MAKNVIDIKKLDYSYNTRILDILSSSPIETNFLKLHFDKSPDFFVTGKLWSNNCTYYGIFKNGILAGFGMHLKYQGVVNAEIHGISYFGNFCIDRKFRNQGLFKLLADYMLKGLHEDTEFSFCLVLKGNRSAEKYFSPGRKILTSMPYYKNVSTYETRNILITRKRKENKKYNIRRCHISDTKLIVNFLKTEYDNRILCPVLNEKIFVDKNLDRPGLKINDYLIAFEKGEVVGVCGVWDTSLFKRTRILEYGKNFLWIRLLYQLVAGMFRYPGLPRPGGIIKEVYLTNIAIKNRDPEVLKSLLSRVYSVYRKKKYNLIIFGSYKGDILLNAASSFFSRSLYSNIYFTSKNENMVQNGSIDFSQPYIDISLI